jgi:subtilisin family serine protease
MRVHGVHTAGRLLGAALAAACVVIAPVRTVDPTAGLPAHTTAAAPAGGICPTSLPIVDQDFAMRATDAARLLRAARAHRRATGAGVVVAVLDGGFDLAHAPLRARVRGGYDAIDGDRDAHDPGNGLDDDRDGVIDAAAGHGTFVAAMVLLAAPDAMILPVRVRDDEGRGSDAMLAAGLEHAWRAGADVINLSVTLAGDDIEAVRDLIAAMHADGVAIVGAAGNGGGARAAGLAALPGVFAVAASDGRGGLARFSDAGRIAAPGVMLRGPLAGGATGIWSGTSFAAGLVSGAAALLRERRPDLEVRSLYAALVEATVPVVGAAQGQPGRIDLWKVVSR